MTEPTAGFREALARYMNALRAAGSEFPDLVRPRADNGALLQSLRDEGKHLPREVVEWFEWFGEFATPTVRTDGWLAPGVECLTLERSIELNRWWQGEGDLYDDELARDWLSVADYDHGASIVVNCGPQLGDAEQATVAYFSDLGELTAKERRLPSLATLLSWWAERVETGGWTFDPNQGWTNHVDPRTDPERYATGLMG